MMRAHAAELLETSPDGIVVHDGERIVAVNAALLRLAGAARKEQVVGRPVAALFEHPHLKGVQRQLVMGAFDSDTVCFVRDRLYGVDGAVHEVDVNARLYLEGERLNVCLVLHDVHDQVAAERQVHEQRIAERLLDTRVDARQVAGGVAHVLNNRLQVILGFANLIGEDPLTDDQRNDLGQIVRAAVDGAEVTRQLLQLAGGAVCNRETVALGALTRRLITQLEADGVTGSAGVEFIEGPVPAVLVDPSHLRHMLVYLLDNARRAVRIRGRITATVGTTVLRQPQLASQGHRIAPGRYASLSIRDTGSGITPEARARMFEPFFTTTMIGDGNGLGLPAVQGLVRQNGGFLTFTSDPGEGTTFTLLFPEADDARVAAAPESANVAVGEATILVIDANAAVRAEIARGLERVGYRVLQAFTAVEALEMIAHLGCPALVVMTDEVERRAVRSLGPLRAQCVDVPMLVLAAHPAPSCGAVAAVPPSLPGKVVRLVGPFSEYLLVSQVQALLREGHG